MEITNLKLSKNGSKVLIYVNNKYWLSVDQNFVIDANLFKGKEVNKEELSDLKFLYYKSFYYQKIINLIARRPRSVNEIRYYLKRKVKNKVHKSVIINYIIKILQKDNYLNDLEFANWWVENRIQFSPRGHFLIVQELKQKGIQDKTINKALEMQSIDRNEEKIALELGRKKKRILGDITNIKNKKRFLSFLMRKGFDYTITNKVYKKLINKINLF